MTETYINKCAALKQSVLDMFLWFSSTSATVLWSQLCIFHLVLTQFHEKTDYLIFLFALNGMYGVQWFRKNIIIVQFSSHYALSLSYGGLVNLILTLFFFRLVCPVQTGLVQVYKYSLIRLLVTVQPWFSPVKVKVWFLAGCLFSPLHFPPPYCFLIGSKPIKTLITHSSDFIHFPKYIFATQPQRT